jgi:hypothetical protein
MDNSKKCTLCEKCILEYTQGICPRKGCPKGFSNAPCSGFLDGHCEVYRTNLCVWTLIYEKLKEHNKADDFIKTYFPPN